MHSPFPFTLTTFVYKTEAISKNALSPPPPPLVEHDSCPLNKSSFEAVLPNPSAPLEGLSAPPRSRRLFCPPFAVPLSGGAGWGPLRAAGSQSPAARVAAAGKPKREQGTILSGSPRGRRGVAVPPEEGRPPPAAPAAGHFLSENGRARGPASSPPPGSSGRPQRAAPSRGPPRVRNDPAHPLPPGPLGEGGGRRRPRAGRGSARPRPAESPRRPLCAAGGAVRAAEAPPQVTCGAGAYNTAGGGGGAAAAAGAVRSGEARRGWRRFGSGQLSRPGRIFFRGAGGRTDTRQRLETCPPAAAFAFLVPLLCLLLYLLPRLLPSRPCPRGGRGV